jgi:hypothetical protein
MKMTVVTQQGKIVGAVYGHTPQPSPDEFKDGPEATFRAGLLAGPGQELHVLEVSDRVLGIDSPKELIAELTGELKKNKKM